MKKIKFFINVCLFIICIFLISSCEEEEKYKLEYYDYYRQLIATQEVGTIDEVIYPVMEDIEIEKTKYKFQGWDINNDNIVDEINVIEGDTIFYAIYIAEKEECVITYSLEDKDYSFIYEDDRFTIDVPNNSYYFLGYYDEQNNPVTDKNGKKLKNYEIEQSLILKPKYLLEGETIFFLEMPKTVVDDEEAKVLEQAILDQEIKDVDSEEENKFLSETTFIYQEEKYEIIVPTTTKNNIFHNLKRIEKEKTYYFKYEPIEFVVEKADYEANSFSIYSKEVVGAKTFRLFDRAFYTGLFHSMILYYEDTSYTSYLDNSLSEIADIEEYILVSYSTLRYTAKSTVPSQEQLNLGMVEPSDFVLATTDVAVSYEYDSFFKIPYISDTVLSPAITDSNIIVFDHYGREQEVQLDDTVYGQMIKYSFSLKEAGGESVL